MWPQDVAIALPCPTQNRSAIPHVSPEARARTFMCTHTQPSQLFPKKGSSLQENSSNQLSRKWREAGGGGEQPPGRTELREQLVKGSTLLEHSAAREQAGPGYPCSDSTLLLLALSAP